MRKISLIIMMLLAFGVAKAGQVSAIPVEELERVNAEFMAVHQLQTAITEAFLEFYAENFGAKVHIQKILLAEDNPQSHLTPVAVTDLVAQAIAHAEEQFPTIMTGDLSTFKAALKSELVNFAMSHLKVDAHSNKVYLYEALNKVLGGVYAHMLPKAEQSNRIPTLHGKEGAEYEKAKNTILEELRSLFIRLRLNKAHFIIDLYGDSETHFEQMKNDYFAGEIDHYLVDELRGDIQDETQENIESFVIPSIRKMLAKKMGTADGKAWHFINTRIKNLIALLPEYEHKKALFRQVLQNSLAQPDTNVDKAEFGDRFKWFINNRLPAFLPELDGIHQKFAKLDQLACNPDLLSQEDQTPESLDYLARFNGNINNYLFFLRYFKYFDTTLGSTKQTAALGKVQDQTFFALYKALLNQRVKYENVHYRTQEWVAYIAGEEFFNDFKDTPYKNKIPVIYAMTALAFERSLPYPAEQFKGLDDHSIQINALAMNQAFFVEYSGFNGHQYPKITVDYRLNLVVPVVGAVTGAEHAVLSNPESLKVIKEKILSGQKVFPMTELDESFESDEEVLVYLQTPEIEECAQDPEEFVNAF